MSVTFLPKSAASTLTYYLSRVPDNSTSVTCTLYGPSGNVLQASATASQFTRTTVTTTSTEGARTLVLTSGSGIVVGDRYWVGPNASGQSEEVTVDAIASATVTTRFPLKYVYGSGHTFASSKVSLSVAAISLAQKNCRAKWSFTYNAQTHTEDQFFHVSSYCPVCTLTEEDLLRREPLARDLVDPEQPLSELIQDIFANDVLSDLIAVWSPESIISGDVLKVATASRLMALCALRQQKFDLYERWVEEYKAAIERAVTTAPADTDDDGSTDDELVAGIMSVKLVRG